MQENLSETRKNAEGSLDGKKVYVEFDEHSVDVHEVKRILFKSSRELLFSLTREELINSEYSNDKIVTDRGTLILTQESVESIYDLFVSGYLLAEREKILKSLEEQIDGVIKAYAHAVSFENKLKHNFVNTLLFFPEDELDVLGVKSIADWPEILKKYCDQINAKVKIINKWTFSMDKRNLDEMRKRTAGLAKYFDSQPPDDTEEENLYEKMLKDVHNIIHTSNSESVHLKMDQQI